ncbi:MAG: hypothetical protein ABIZ49_07470 [Opitutaceae bacterium]
MNLQPDPVTFRRRLEVWTLRGVFCAAPSFLLATFSAGLQQPSDFVAMFAGIATCVVVFAWVTSLPAYQERIDSTDFGWAMRFAANARAVLAPGFLFGPDVWLGMVSIMIVRTGFGAVGLWSVGSASPPLPSGDFPIVYATTLVQGALVSITMLMLALPVWGVRRVWNARKRSRAGVRVGEA